MLPVHQKPLQGQLSQEDGSRFPDAWQPVLKIRRERIGQRRRLGREEPLAGMVGLRSVLRHRYDQKLCRRCSWLLNFHKGGANLLLSADPCPLRNALRPVANLQRKYLHLHHPSLNNPLCFIIPGLSAVLVAGVIRIYSKLF